LMQPAAIAGIVVGSSLFILLAIALSLILYSRRSSLPKFSPGAAVVKAELVEMVQTPNQTK
jgi:hypothetical protein